jgi:L-fuconolactonase
MLDGRPIVDTHVHLTDVSRLAYPWMENVPFLNKDWTLADYNRCTAGLNIDAMVFVEVDAASHQKIAEAQFVASLAADEPRLKGCVAGAIMDQSEETAKTLAALAEIPLVRGVRHLIQGHVATPGWACRPEMIEGVRTLGQLGLSFDVCIMHPQMRDAATLVRACPDVLFILDHIGKPGIKAGFYDQWAADLADLATLPNVMCKISGVVTEADHAAWTESQVLPYITHAMNMFGQDRVMFGSDWFVSELATTYQRWVTTVEKAITPFGASFADRLWRENAKRVYRV